MANGYIYGEHERMVMYPGSSVEKFTCKWKDTQDDVYAAVVNKDDSAVMCLPSHPVQPLVKVIK